MSLNVGRHNDNLVSDDDKDLIAEFIRTKGVQQIQPSGLSGNEASRVTNEIIADARKQFRAKMRGKTL